MKDYLCGKNKYFQFKFVFLIFNIFLCSLYLSSSFAGPIPNAKYTFDQQTSQMNFQVKNLGFLTVDGKFKKFSGIINFITPFEKSQVEVNADISSIDTDSSSRDEHLRSSDFFDQEKYPTMTFKSTQVEGTLNSFKLMGDLTIKGVKKTVTFTVTGHEDKKNKDEYDFLAKTKINRNDFGITHGATISNDVTIQFEIHAVPSKNNIK
ncbi:MAG: YceI family protein [Bdellovibrionota bacterium]